MATGKEFGISLELVNAVQNVNSRQKQLLAGKVRSVLGHQLADSKVAVWGLAFKAQTDDIRESPALDLIEALLESGARVIAFDPKARETAWAIFGDRVQYAATAYDALDGADVLVIVTEWMAFRNPDFSRMKSLLRRAIVVDGRNLYDPRRMKELGFTYVSIGRGGLQ